MAPGEWRDLQAAAEQHPHMQLVAFGFQIVEVLPDSFHLIAAFPDQLLHLFGMATIQPDGAKLAAEQGRGGNGYHGGSGYHGGGSVSPWAGLAVFGALAGLAIMAESSRPVYGEPYNAVPAYAPQEVYIEGQPEAGVPPANPASAWYYCASSAMYYPYTKACPEGWQAVPAHPY